MSPSMHQDGQQMLRKDLHQSVPIADEEYVWYKSNIFRTVWMQIPYNDLNLIQQVESINFVDKFKLNNFAFYKNIIY